MLSFERKAAWIVAALLLHTVMPMSGAQTAPASIPIFKTRSELVTVPVIVTDHYGSHVTHLKKEDFLVLEDGAAQKIAVFEEVNGTSFPQTHPQREPDQFSNLAAKGSVPGNLTIIVLDRVNTPFEDQAFATQQILKYLQESLDRGQPTSLFVITQGGLKVVHDFTTDPSPLIAALKRVRGGREAVERANQEAIPTGTPPEVAKLMEMERMAEQRMESLQQLIAIRTTLQAMQQIARYCVGLPGRKALLWASGGFPFAVNENSMVFNIGGPKLDSYADVADLYQTTWKELNQAQIALYPIDVGGLVNPTMPDIAMRNPQASFAAHADWMHEQNIATFTTFAQATGGRAFYNTNDLAAALEKAVDDSSSYYLLSYYLDRTDKKPGWRKLTIKVHQEGAQVRARSGFFLTNHDQGHDDESALRIALASPLDSTAISLSGHWQEVLPAPEAGKKKIIFLLTVPANFAEIDANDDNHILIQFVAVALTESRIIAGENSKTMDGHLKPASLAQIRDHGMDYRGSLVVPPGDYTVHFAVVDHLSGRIGSVSAPLKVTP